MKLPRHEFAVVPQEKLVNYLLSTTHRDGRHKAAFFNEFGFSASNWQSLADALMRHVAEHEVAREAATEFGVRYVVEGIMEMADSREALVRSVWFIDQDQDTPRFVTAYPV